ncbi:hypothetical protein HanPSC8_Chr10g0409621 [Helianthus annuus]|nr:hypothetical protein HanPSC8_Chr10g0409621 [Helianthus annuus]
MTVTFYANTVEKEVWGGYLPLRVKVLDISEPIRSIDVFCSFQVEKVDHKFLR